MKVALVTFFILASMSPTASAFCLAPFALADRWDDASPVTGYAGSSRKEPDWRNDGVWECESFTDLNGNSLYDPGEGFDDANGNGIHDAELYGFSTTGYVVSPTPENVISPGGDLGLQITLVPAASPRDERAGHYLALQSDCDVVLQAQRPTGADLRAIDDFFRGQIAADPDAAWDPVTKQVVGSKWCISPRLVPLPIYDPRQPLSGVHGTVQATKILEVFLEDVVGKGSVTIRIAAFPAINAAACDAAQKSSSTSGAVLRENVTWGKLRASYR